MASDDMKVLGVMTGGAAAVAALSWLASRSKSLSEEIQVHAAEEFDPGFGEGGRWGYIKRDVSDYWGEIKEGARHPFRSYGRAVKRGMMPLTSESSKEDKAEILAAGSKGGLEGAALELGRQEAGRKRIHLAGVIPAPNPVQWALGPRRKITTLEVQDTKKMIETPGAVAEKGKGFLESKFGGLGKYFGRK